MPEGFSDRMVHGEQWRIFTLDDPQNGFQVQMGESYALRNHLINHIAKRLVMPLLLALPLLGLLISFGIHRALSPLRSLTRAVARRAPDSLEPVVVQDIPTEITPLVDALNNLFARLETAFENERRFTADAAHELETGCPVGRAEILGAFLERFERYYDLTGREGFVPVIRRWRELSDMTGRPVRVHSFSGSVEGAIAGIDDEGVLLLTGVDGTVERVISGDVDYL